MAFIVPIYNEKLIFSKQYLSHNYIFISIFSFLMIFYFLIFLILHIVYCILIVYLRYI